MISFNIAIDGYSASGKTSIGKILAKKLNFNFIDTGLMYRAFTYFCLSKDKDYKNNKILIGLLDNFNLKFKNEDNIFINFKKIDKKKLYLQIISKKINFLSRQKIVREKMVKIQKELAKSKKCIMVGRDIGTVVLPNAKFKFFITASIEERAKRRLKNFLESKTNTTYKEVIQDLINRDKDDTTRKFSPLVKSNNSILIDNTNKTIIETVNDIIEIIYKKVDNE